MQGFATFEPSPAPLDSDAVPVPVFRLTPGVLDGPGQYQLLPNILMLRSERRIGAYAGRARFRYIFDPSGAVGDPDWPSTPEDVLAPEASGPYIVSPDDRLVAFGVTDGGDLRIMFDGYARIPKGVVGPSRSVVEFDAIGTPIRCWDSPIYSRVEHDCDYPDIKVLTTQVDLPVVFNPEGLANATDEGKDGELPWDDDITTPMFLDPLVCKSRKIGRKWSLAMAVHYILATYNDEEFVDNGLLSVKDSILDGRKPIDPAGDWDPQDSTTYTSAPVIIRELDVTGMAWPVALEKLLKAYGFNFVFDLSQDDNNMPTWFLRIFRVMQDDPLSYKQLHLQEEGDDLDPALTNLMSMTLDRDSDRIENDVTIVGREARYEGSFVLAPAFPIVEADANDIGQFDVVDSASLDNGGDDTRDFDAYRTYVFDEAGDGHNPLVDGAWQGYGTDAGATSLAKILSKKGNDESAYVKRRRPGRRKLFSVDENGEPRSSILLLSTDYKGPVPGVWDRTGTWYEVGHAWRLLDDRLGIHLTAKSVEGWQTGNKKLSFGVSYFSGGGIVKGVTAQARPTETHFILMLVTVIEGDTVLSANAPKRSASPTEFTVKKYIEARERYRLDTIASSSWFNPPQVDEEDPPNVASRDDTDDAKYEAAQRRATHEMPPVVGTVTLGRLVNSYSLVDRITSIDGRDLDLQTNMQADGEAPMYPMVVGLEYDLDGHQHTILHLSDQRTVDVGG